MDSKMKKPSMNIGSDFNDKMKSWFLNKGILNKLEGFLRSQLMIEFQKNCGQMINSKNNSVLSPKTQAIKVLIADFLLQQDLLFSLSVYFSEVPFLSNLSQFNQYINHLSEIDKKTDSIPYKPKPKFSINDLTDIVEALNFDLNPAELQFLYKMYIDVKFNSLLSCLLNVIPKLIKKFRNSVTVLKKSRRKERIYSKLLRAEKIRTRRMYCLLQEAYRVVDKRRNEMKEFLQKQDVHQMNSAALTEKLAELSKKESELMAWHRALDLKEGTLDKVYQNKMQEVLEKSKRLADNNLELQNKLQTLNNEKEELRIEKERIEYWRHASEIKEVAKLSEFERKFQSLQEEVKEMLKTYTERQNNKHEVENKGQQTIDDYVNLMEKENSLLKLSSNRQRDYISQLTSEVDFLKKRLDQLEEEMKTRNKWKLENHNREIIQKLNLLGNKNTLYSESDFSSRRKLFAEETADSKSSSNSKDSDLTDKIVADAKTKVKKLEEESEALDRNSKNLLDIMNRSIAFSENRYNCSTSLSDSSPSFRGVQIPRLRKAYSDTGSSNASPDLKCSTLPINIDAKYSGSTSDSPRSSRLQWNTFHGMLMKYKQDQKRKKQRGSENSSSSSTPRKSEIMKIDPDIRKQEQTNKTNNSVINEIKPVEESRPNAVVKNNINLSMHVEMKQKNQLESNVDYRSPQIHSDNAENEDRIEISADLNEASDFWK